MRVCGCTIAARQLLPSAAVVARSFAQQHPELDFFALLADTPAPPGGQDAVGAGTLLSVEDLGRPDLLHRAFRTDQQEFSYALTPVLLAHLLDRGYDAVLFYKQESLLVGRQDAAIERLRTCATLLTPHLLGPLEGGDAVQRERTILLSGVYNLGFLGVADRPQARELLTWWDARLETHCRRDVARGLHFEQRWMDLAPSTFGGVEVLRDPAFNVGHWNVTERSVTADPDGHDVRVAGRPCALVRFSGYDPDRPQRMTRYVDRVPVAALGDAAAVFARYRDALLDAGWETARHAPYGYATFADGVAIPELARAVHRGLSRTDVDRFGDPFAVGPDTFREWLCAPVDAVTPPVSALMLGALEARGDLSEAFPRPLGADREAFASWWQEHREDHGVPVALDPAVPVTRGPAVVTVVTADRLAQARVLAASLRTHHADLVLHVLVVGPQGDETGDEPFVRLTRPLPGSAVVDGLLLDGRIGDAVVRAKAAAVQRLLHAGHDRVLYLDADTEVLGDLAPLLDAAGEHAVTLVPHAVAPQDDTPPFHRDLLLVTAGTYNAGVLAVRGGPVASAFLEWWGGRSVAGAPYGPHDGVFYDQRWLDLVPGLFEDVGILRDPRYDIGPWNVHQRAGEEWRLVHYSGFDPERPERMSQHHPTIGYDGAGPAREVYDRYAAALLATGWRPADRRAVAFADGVPVPPHTGEIAATAPDGAFDRDDLLGAGPASLRHWLAAPADDVRPAVPNYWLGLRARRGDLCDAFPEPLGADREAFARWCREHGPREYEVDAAFVPG